MQYEACLKAIESVATSLDAIARDLADDAGDDAVTRALLQGVRERVAIVQHRLRHQASKASTGLAATHLIRNDEGELELRDERGTVVAVVFDEVQAKLFRECSQVFEGMTCTELQAVSILAEDKGMFDDKQEAA